MNWQEILRFFYSEANGLAITNIIMVLAFIGGFLWAIIKIIGFLLTHFKRNELEVSLKEPINLVVPSQEAQLPLNPDKPVFEISLDRYQADLKNREDELRAELAEAHAGEKALLQDQIGELTRQQENPEDAFKAFKTRIAELEALLGNAETEDEQAAKAALEAGDLMEADAIFARISAAQSMNVKKAADAEYARGEIAEQQIRWEQAVAHYEKAASFDGSYRNLNCAQRMNLFLGRFESSLELGAKKIELADKQFGEISYEFAEALNDYALALKSLGHLEEAEPLYRRAIKIDQKTVGKKHIEHAIHLNNLAGLLKEKGDLDEAELLCREALVISETTIGKDHPNYATGVNNLASLLQAKGERERAEPLFLEAMDIRASILGKNHPDYAASLANLAMLLHAKGDLSGAEPLFREAIEIGEATIGKDHPHYATGLNNLAMLLRAKGDLDEAEPLFEQAIEIHSKSLGEDHPNTKTSRENLRLLREEMGKPQD